MAKVKVSILKRTPIENNDYEFRNYDLGEFELEIIPRIGETVFYQTEDNMSPGFYNVTQINHFLDPKFPTELILMTDDDEPYYLGK